MIAVVEEKYERLSTMMNEKLRRRWAACEAMAIGRGGISAVSEATGISRTTIRKGMREIREEMPDLAEDVEAAQIRKPGGGRRSTAEKNPKILADLQELLESNTRGDPTCPLLWTSKSTRKLSRELQQKGYDVSHVAVANLLEQLDYSLQANRKTREGSRHPDRHSLTAAVTPDPGAASQGHSRVSRVGWGNLAQRPCDWSGKRCTRPTGSWGSVLGYGGAPGPIAPTRGAPFHRPNRVTARSTPPQRRTVRRRRSGN